MGEGGQREEDVYSHVRLQLDSEGQINLREEGEVRSAVYIYTQSRSHPREGEGDIVCVCVCA